MIHRNSNNFIVVDKQWLIRLKNDAKQSEKQMARLLMHHAVNDYVQEMLIAFTDQCNIKPNHSENKTESLQVLEGELLLTIFNEQGKVLEEIEMGPVGSSKPFLYRFHSSPWHTMSAKTPEVVVHEILQGPFVKVEEKEPEWLKQYV